MPDDTPTPTPEQQLEGQIALAFEQAQPQPTPTTQQTPPQGGEGAVAVPPVEGQTADGSQPTPTPPAPQPPATVTINGQDYAVEDIQAVIDFQAWARANPQAIQQMDDVFSGRATVVPTQTPPAPPAAADPNAPTDDDLADLSPAIRARLGEIDEIKAQLAAVNQTVAQRQFIDSRSAVGVGMQTFAQKYDLDAPTVDAIAASVAQTGMLRQFTALVGGDVARATADALEAMYFRNPANRQRELDRQTKINAEVAARQKNASRVSGSSGSASREAGPAEGQPQTREQLQKGLVEALRGLSNGQTVE